MWGSLKDRGNRIKAELLSLLYPSSCPICGNRSDRIELSPLCSKCWGSINRYSGPSCHKCARPLMSEHSLLCSECIADPPYFSSIVSYGVYSDCLAMAINLMKFSGIKRLSGPLSRLILRVDIPDSDVIIPVPMTKRSLLKRGYNQSLLLAKGVSTETGIPLDIDSLQKVKETLPQVGLKAEERRKNLRNAFFVKRDVKGKKVLLIDDVMTTGATLKECSKALLKAGALMATGLVLARTGLEDIN